MPIRLLVDQTLGAEEMKGVRQAVIEVRDAAVKEARFDYAIHLSLAVAIIGKMIEVEEEGEILDSEDEPVIDDEHLL